MLKVSDEQELSYTYSYFRSLLDNNNIRNLLEEINKKTPENASL